MFNPGYIKQLEKMFLEKLVDCGIRTNRQNESRVKINIMKNQYFAIRNLKSKASLLKKCVMQRPYLFYLQFDRVAGLDTCLSMMCRYQDTDLAVRFCKDVESRSQMLTPKAIQGYVDFGRFDNYFVAGIGQFDFVQEFYNGDLMGCEQSYDKMGRTAQVGFTLELLFLFWSTSSVGVVRMDNAKLRALSPPRLCHFSLSVAGCRAFLQGHKRHLHFPVTHFSSVDGVELQQHCTLTLKI
ncbi:hypothetical protein AHAS_Ahas01G0009300 [Arachis hypogaea]